jgi:hypothetical protein
MQSNYNPGSFLKEFCRFADVILEKYNSWEPSTRLKQSLDQCDRWWHHILYLVLEVVLSFIFRNTNNINESRKEMTTAKFLFCETRLKSYVLVENFECFLDTWTLNLTKFRLLFSWQLALQSFDCDRHGQSLQLPSLSDGYCYSSTPIQMRSCGPRSAISHVWNLL